MYFTLHVKARASHSSADNTLRPPKRLAATFAQDCRTIKDPRQLRSFFSLQRTPITKHCSLLTHYPLLWRFHCHSSFTLPCPPSIDCSRIIPRTITATLYILQASLFCISLLEFTSALSFVSPLDCCLLVRSACIVLYPAHAHSVTCRVPSGTFHSSHTSFLFTSIAPRAKLSLLALSYQSFPSITVRSVALSPWITWHFVLFAPFHILSEPTL